ADTVLLEQSRLLIDVSVQLSFTGETHGVLRRATAAIEKLHDNPDTKSGEIARAINVSLRQLDRLFAERGTSTAKQITVVRVGHARRLMTESSLSISEIAYRCGFGSADTMTRQFKLLFGATPHSVRETMHSTAS
ncbi:MAG: helix-turn-helix domain-containing protein, partial [Actinomycetales bacterium]|nr:helix-turn-helix domain-containing protein [Actinomycetales bacterium]